MKLIEPTAISSLLNVLNGSILDIFIDLRKNSDTYQCYGSCELNSESGLLYIPKGFAHGFITLSDNTMVSYKVDNFYNVDSERGINLSDDFFSFDLGVSINEVIISDKDAGLPLWNEISDKVNF